MTFDYHLRPGVVTQTAPTDLILIRDINLPTRSAPIPASDGTGAAFCLLSSGEASSSLRALRPPHHTP